MKKIIVRFNFHDLRNEVHVVFNGTVDSLFIKYNPETLGIVALYAVYKALLTEEVAALDIILRSKLTEIIDRFDHERDSLWRGMVTTTKGYLQHFDPDKREAAHQLLLIFDHYGNIPRKNLEAETGAIEDLHTELIKQENYIYITALGLGEWLGQLVQASRNLDAQMKGRYDEIGKRPDLHMRSIRKQVDKALYDIFDRIESLVNVNGEENYKAFISELNAVMEREKDVLAQEAARRHPIKDLGAGDHTVIEPVETQKYTGQPITIVPEVHYREEGKETKRLYLGEDFSITYKDNVEVGQAELTIHGKGDYKGQKSLSFHIAR